MRKLLLSLLLLSPLMARPAVKIGNIYYDLKSGTNVAEVAPSPNFNYTGVVNIPSTVNYNGVYYNVTSIGENAFLVCRELTSVIIPNSVTTIGRNAFGSCFKLSSVNIPNNLTTIGPEVFWGCHSLTSIIIPISVTSIGERAFQECNGLQNIIVIEGNPIYDSRDNCNAIIETSSNKLLWGCNNTIIPDGVTSINENAFYSCESLTNITIPNSVTSIGKEAFMNCIGLSSVILGDCLTSLGNSVFKGCKQLSSIIIPNSVTSIGEHAFDQCGLTNVSIGSNVKLIGECSFMNNGKLASVTIPKSVEYIGSNAFWGCGLTSVIAEHSSPLFISSSTFFNYDNAILYVPYGGKEIYSNAEYWRDFMAIIEMEQPEKCATPTISFSNGKLKFDCETESVTFVPTISFTDENLYQGNEIDYGTTFRISVYAKKDGYENSDVVTKDFDLAMYLGDANHDGKVSIADAVAIVDIILNSPTPEPEIKYYYSVGAEEVTSANYTTVNNAQYKASLAEIPETLDLSTVVDAKAYILLPEGCVPIVRSTTGVVGTTSISVGNEHTVYTTTSAINGSECTCTVYK